MANSFRIGAPGVITEFDGRMPHFILPFAGDRVSIVAFTHQAIFSIAARPHIDSLRTYGFRRPEDAGACKAFITTTARDLCRLDDAAAKYAECCDEVMHIATSARVAEAKSWTKALAPAFGWSAMAKVFMACILASLAQGTSLVKDRAWHDRLRAGGLSRYQGVANTRGTSCGLPDQPQWSDTVHGRGMWSSRNHSSPGWGGLDEQACNMFGKAGVGVQSEPSDQDSAVYGEVPAFKPPYSTVHLDHTDQASGEGGRQAVPVSSWLNGFSPPRDLQDNDHHVDPTATITKDQLKDLRELVRCRELHFEQAAPMGCSAWGHHTGNESTQHAPQFPAEVCVGLEYGAVPPLRGEPTLDSRAEESPMPPLL